MDVEIFDDIYSIMHFLLGIFAILFNIDVSFTLLYVAYQLIERESENEKLGDIIEYVVGLVVGAIIRATVNAHC